MESVSIKYAAKWASEYLKKKVTSSRISYLVQYGAIKNHSENDFGVKIDLGELKNYYEDYYQSMEKKWEDAGEENVNWTLSFREFSERETTKHVHRLHPYKGKFIPQLVEYFLDDHVDDFKTEVFFEENSIIIDPFLGSGTTLVQAAELNMHSIGIDISGFNCLIGRTKMQNYRMIDFLTSVENNLRKTLFFSDAQFNSNLDEELKNAISEFNKQHFPSPSIRWSFRQGEIEESEYSSQKLEEFYDKTSQLIATLHSSHEKNKKHNIKSEFLEKWYSPRIFKELLFYEDLIKETTDENIQNALRIILTRTARSCRSTTHSDLATLTEPQIGPYYCRKHKKICTPLSSSVKHLKRYSHDTLKRIQEFSELKANVNSEVLHGDSRTIDILKSLRNLDLSKQLKNQRADGVFTSPPYVGQIDYHEQHAYAYELLGLDRFDEKEIGPLYKGRGREAKESYVKGISEVLINTSRFVKDTGHFFLVANDKLNLYPEIAELSNLNIVDEFKRPVLNRTERDRQPYSESIFHMKKNVS